MLIHFFIEMEKAFKELLDHQSQSERLKNFPYPLQYAIINVLFIRLICILLPFGLLKEFGVLHQGWLVISFNVVILRLYTSLHQMTKALKTRSTVVPTTYRSRRLTG